MDRYRPGWAGVRDLGRRLDQSRAAGLVCRAPQNLFVLDRGCGGRRGARLAARRLRVRLCWRATGRGCFLDLRLRARSTLLVLAVIGAVIYGAILARCSAGNGWGLCASPRGPDAASGRLPPVRP